MYRKHAVGVVVPAYNEEGFAGEVIEGMPSFVDRIYAVDDRSTDGTWKEILAAAEADAAVRAPDGGTVDSGTDTTSDTGIEAETGGKNATAATARRSGGDDRRDSPLFERASVQDPIGRVLPIRHEHNRGAGGAIKTGYLAALQDDLAVDIVATIDADGQMDSGLLPRFLNPIVEGDAEYTKGNRLLDREAREEMPTFRLFGNAMLTFLTKIASGYWKTMDPQNGYTTISTSTLRAIDVKELYEYYGYCTDLLIKLNVERAHVADVAMPARYGEETSSIKYEEYIRKVSLLLLRGFLWRLKTRYLLFDFHPLALLYGLGALTTGTGVLEGVSTVRKRLAARGQSSDLPATGTDVGSGSWARSALTVAVGCTILILSMIFDLEANEGLETQVKE
ncbi:glycosyltransferase family 2 protein [Halobacteriales archaeon QS_3_64_16]|nr:MAG: glycosyltransferase family 2 protein [Halobacteriales archaeon QS_3_64_16]